MSPAVSSVLEVALAPCAGCGHARDHHLGCRAHEGCCDADACGCMGYQPATYKAADADAWDTVLRWDARPATRQEIEYVAAWMGCDADELETAVREEERRAREGR